MRRDGQEQEVPFPAYAMCRLPWLAQNTNAKQSPTSPCQVRRRDHVARPPAQYSTSGPHPYHQTSQPPPASHGATLLQSPPRHGEPIPKRRIQELILQDNQPQPSLLRLHVLRSTVPLTHRHNPLPQPTNPFWVPPTQEMSSPRRYKENDRDRDREREHTRSRTKTAHLQRLKRRDIWKKKGQSGTRNGLANTREPRDSTRTRHRIESDSEGIANVDCPSAHRRQRAEDWTAHRRRQPEQPCPCILCELVRVIPYHVSLH